MEAAGIVRKEERDAVRYVGMPLPQQEESPEYRELRRERDECLRRIEERRFELRESVLHSIGCRNLKRRNAHCAPYGHGAATTRGGAAAPVSPIPRSCESAGGGPNAAAGRCAVTAAAGGRRLLKVPTDGRIPLPFLVANLPSTAKVSQTLRVAADAGSRMKFQFSEPFDINDDHQMLKWIGLCTTTLGEMEQWLHRDVILYMHSHNLLGGVLVDPTKMRQEQEHQPTLL
mmetsp:Transcript_35540/g.106095  ORF Transcript_35540/g.106095 Transcript_35540/m.106095 type:complete len:230 (+) Transcript_35540:502-1191(+)